MPEVDYAMRCIVPTDVLMRDLDGEAIILDLNSQYYFGLDDVGTRMWSALASSPSVQAAYERLLEEFDVDAERLQTDLSAFVELLLERGLLIGSDA